MTTDEALEKILTDIEATLHRHVAPVVAGPDRWENEVHILLHQIWAHIRALAVSLPAEPAALPEGYRVFKDGNAWCAVGKDFVNLQESKAGFGHTPLVALGELIVEEGKP